MMTAQTAGPCGPLPDMPYPAHTGQAGSSGKTRGCEKAQPHWARLAQALCAARAHLHSLGPCPKGEAAFVAGQQMLAGQRGRHLERLKRLRFSFGQLERPIGQLEGAAQGTPPQNS